MPRPKKIEQEAPDRESCANCRFNYKSVCTRFPPVIAGTVWAQPLVTHIAWCGEYQKK